jgi:hypothetical protein
MSREVRIPKPHATWLRSQASSCRCKHTRIIENRQQGTSCPITWNKPTSKWQDKQTMNTSTSLLFTISIAFYYEMRVECPLWACCKFPTWMMHGLDYRPRCFSNTYTNSMISQDPNLFHITSIHKQKITISTQMRESAMLKACPMAAWLG